MNDFLDNRTFLQGGGAVDQHRLLALGLFLLVSGGSGSGGLGALLALADILHVLPRLAQSGERLETAHLGSDDHRLGGLADTLHHERFDALARVLTNSLHLVHERDQALHVSLVAPRERENNEKKSQNK